MQTGAMEEEERESAEEFLELAHCCAVITELYRRLDVLTYADLLSLSYEILAGSAVARKEEETRCQYLLVDEFQDTNTIQAEIAYYLTGKAANIFVVGDDDQSIYRFRGANIDNILEFKERYPQSVVITLVDNYRSTQQILDAAYRLIQHNNPHRLEAALKIDKRLRSVQGAGAAPEALWFSTSAHEAEGIASRIQSLITDGYAPSDIAVLAHAHNHLDAIEDELRGLSIPITRGRESSFFEEPTVISALAFLRFLANPQNSDNLFRLLTGEPFDVPATRLIAHNVRARKGYHSLWEALAEAELSATATEGVAVAYLQASLTKAGENPAQALRDHVYRSKWQNRLVEAEETDSARLLTMLYNQAKTYTALHRPATIHAFVEQCDRLAGSGTVVTVDSEQEREQDGVQLLTVHASKGLEFQAVFVCSMVMRRFPGPDQSRDFSLPSSLFRQLTDQVLYEEERRLAYVALTRAKERLFLCGASKYGTNKTPSKPSVFIVEALGQEAPAALSDSPLRNAMLVEAPSTHMAHTLEMPRKIGASALESFEDNPAVYYEQYVLQLIPEESVSISFGTCIHAVLRDILTAQQQNEPYDVEALFARHWDGTGYATPAVSEQERQAGLQMVTQYLSRLDSQMRPEKIEEGITLALPTGIRITGKIDRIDRLPNGKLRIVDYKTGNKQAKIADVRENLPLALYTLALAQAGEVVDEVQLCYLRTSLEPLISVDAAYLSAAELRVNGLVSGLEEAYRTGHFPDSGKRYAPPV
jgi:DNA helicase-2/ATP-dependent DNA helicase PcrA